MSALPDAEASCHGPAGKVLDELLASVQITREEIYITNILKCHPPGNRDPLEEEKRDFQIIREKLREVEG